MLIRFERVRLIAEKRRASIALGVGIALVASTSWGCSNPDEGSAFDSPRRAAEAFAPEELPDIDPWTDEEGECRVLLVGDSLVEATLRAQADAFSYLGCESIVDGLAGRSLSEGWQCLADGGRSMAIVVRATPEPGNSSCRPSGLELLRQWADLTRAASATVIALGTNDAGIYSEEGWIRRWTRVVEITNGPLVFVTVSGRPGDRWVDNADRYNATLRWWCPKEPRCVLAEWDLTTPARDTASYVDHVHLTRAAGEMRAIFIAAAVRRAAIPAPGGPRRWRAPVIVVPAASSSTSAVSTVPYVPPGTLVTPPWLPPSTQNVTTTAPATSTIATTTSTTTSLVP